MGIKYRILVVLLSFFIGVFAYSDIGIYLQPFNPIFSAQIDGAIKAIEKFNL